MKAETQIAQENIDGYIYLKEKYEMSSEEKSLTKEITTNKYNKVISKCEEHKATCQRFLEFFELTRWSWSEESAESFNDKEVDIEQAIKLYNEAGV